MWHGFLAVVLLTWGSQDPALLVRLERQDAPHQPYRFLATVPGTMYLDLYAPSNQQVCYRVRYDAAQIYTRAACAR